MREVVRETLHFARVGCKEKEVLHERVQESQNLQPIINEVRDAECATNVYLVETSPTEIDVVRTDTGHFVEAMMREPFTRLALGVWPGD